MDRITLPPTPPIGFILSILFWGIAYALMIRRGFKEKVYTYPALGGLCAFVWETLGWTIRYFPEGLYPSFIWSVVDSVLFYQILKYGPDEFEHPFIKKYFRAIVIATSIYVAIFMCAFETDYDDRYRFVTGYGVNVVISPLFIAMLLRRNSSRGQSMYIAISKLLGSVVVYLQLLYNQYALARGETGPMLLDERHMLFVGVEVVGVLIIDIIYVILLYKMLKEEGEPVWRRF